MRKAEPRLSAGRLFGPGPQHQTCKARPLTLVDAFARHSSRPCATTSHPEEESRCSSHCQSTVLGQSAFRESAVRRRVLQAAQAAFYANTRPFDVRCRTYPLSGSTQRLTSHRVTAESGSCQYRCREKDASGDPNHALSRSPESVSTPTRMAQMRAAHVCTAAHSRRHFRHDDRHASPAAYHHASSATVAAVFRVNMSHERGKSVRETASTRGLVCAARHSHACFGRDDKQAPRAASPYATSATIAAFPSRCPGWREMHGMV